MMKTIGKKGAFETINAGMIAFVSFVLITVLVILLIGITKQTSIVCPTVMNPSGTCAGDCVNSSHTAVNWSTCCKLGNAATCKLRNQSARYEYSGAAYNATKSLQTAAQLPPQFAQIIVIVVVIVGILGMLAFVGYGAYQKMRR